VHPVETTAGAARSSDDRDANGGSTVPAALLLVHAGAGARLAVPLACVSRLEEADRSAIERSVGRQAMRYRDRVLPLLDVGARFGDDRPARAAASEGAVDVVVVTIDGRSAGLLVDGIVDIVEEAVELQTDGALPGTLGTALVQGRVTDVLDVPWLLSHWTSAA
jgi:two-component system chemotaxis sensor kinase CheA